MQHTDLIKRIENLRPSFNKAFTNVADYILKNQNELKYLRVKQLAEKCDVSESTITRFIKRIGFSSFHNFKMTVATIGLNGSGKERESLILGDIEKNDTLKIIKTKLQNEFVSTIDDTFNNLDMKAIEKAVEAILQAKSIRYYCTGNSSVAAKHAYLRFYRAGIASNVYTDPAEMGASAALLGPDDIAIGISYSGKTEVVHKSIKIAKQNGATTISITGPNKSPLNTIADIKITTRIEELDDFQISSFSRLTQMVILDMIYAGVTVKKYDKTKKLIEKSAHLIREVLNN